MNSLKGKVIWLTGASSGIGEALVREMLERGVRLAVTSRREDVLLKAADSLGTLKENLFVYAGDVRDLERMKSIAADVESKVGPIDILVANAGTHVFTKPEEFDSKEYLDLMNLNFGGMLHAIEAVLPAMLERQRGQVAGVASLAGFRGLPRAGAYGASKSAMIHFLESIRFHLAPKGIKVTVINPGFVKTPLTDKNDFYMPFLITSAQAAKAICDGLERGKNEICFPRIFSMILKGGRVLPYPIYERIVDRLW
jgi:short-subunit dehydrogenase